MFSRQLPFSAPSSPHSKPLSIYSLLCFPGSCILGLFFGYPRLGYFPSLILFRFIWLSTPQFLPYTNQRFLNGLYSVSYLLTAQRSLNLRFLSLSCFLNGVCEWKDTPERFISPFKCIIPNSSHFGRQKTHKKLILVFIFLPPLEIISMSPNQRWNQSCYNSAMEHNREGKIIL